MQIYEGTEGRLVEALGHLWVAYSPASGETALLNDECAAVLEVLGADALSSERVAGLLSANSGIDTAEAASLVESAWPRLIEIGLVRQRGAGSALAM